MKKRDDNKKGVTKIKLKKTRGPMVNKRINQREPDLLKEIRLKLKPLGKAYNKFKEKRRIVKQKEEQRRLKEEEERKLKDEVALRQQEQEERRLKKEKKIKEEEERRLKAQEDQRLEEKRIKEERQERIREERIYKERLIKGEQERIKQLERVNESREEKINLKEERRLDDKQKKKRLNGTVKWFNDAKGYGFIKGEDKEKDVFVHFSAVQNSGLKYLKKGEQLTFEVEYSDKGPSALNLQKTVNEVSRPHLKVVK